MQQTFMQLMQEMDLVSCHNRHAKGGTFMLTKTGFGITKDGEQASKYIMKKVSNRKKV